MELTIQWEYVFYIMTAISKLDSIEVVSIYILCLKVLFLHTFVNMVCYWTFYLIADKWNPSLNSYIFWDKWNWESFSMFKSYLYFSFCEFSSLSFLPSLFPSFIPPFLLPPNCLLMSLHAGLMKNFSLIYQCFISSKETNYFSFLCQCKFFFLMYFFF